jgi:hypothetical protein
MYRKLKRTMRKEGEIARPGGREKGPPATPRWVKAFAAVALVLFAAFALLHLNGRSPHSGHSSPDTARPASHSKQP